MRILYSVQNVGGIDFSRDLGDTVPVKKTLRGLAEIGHTVHLLRLQGRSVRLGTEMSEPDQNNEVDSGLAGSWPFRLFESSVRRLQRELRLPYFALFDSFRFYEACRRLLPGYELCHEHNGLFSAGTALACRELGVPYVLTFSADPLMELDLLGQPLKGLHRRAAAEEARFTYRAASRILSVSEPARKHLISRWNVQPERIAVMPNGVDFEMFGATYNPAAARAEFGLNGALVVGFVGTFQLWHGLEGLVDSFANVVQVLPQAKLILIGDGPARTKVQARINAHGLTSSVVITGIVPQEQVPRLLSTVDVGVIPYPKLPHELWFSPLKLYEFMAAGKAIVASRLGQIAEVLEDGVNGCLVEAGDVTGFSRAIVTLLRDPDLRSRLGRAAREQALAKHSWQHYVSSLESIYRELL